MLQSYFLKAKTKYAGWVSKYLNFIRKMIVSSVEQRQPTEQKELVMVAR